MQRYISNSPDLTRFGISATFNVYDRSITFSIYNLTTLIGSGNTATKGVCISVVDSKGVTLASYDWDNPQIPSPLSTSNAPLYLGNSTYTLDLGFWDYNFLFQSYKIKAAIKDSNDNIYEVVFPVKQVSMPKDFTDYGYVQGCIDVTADCTNSLLTVKDNYPYCYKDLEPLQPVVTDGTLYYPLGTIDPIPFAYTPFTNNRVYTGTYRVDATVQATYDLGDDFYVVINYTTCKEFVFNCEKHMVDLSCCIEELVQQAQQHCGDSTGIRAANLLQQAAGYILVGIIKENSGQDASYEAKQVRSILKCSCGKRAIKHVQLNPVNPTIYNIVITGIGGSDVSSSTVGNTKTYLVQSDDFEVGKLNPDDLAFEITVDTATANVIKYLLSFDYDVMASYIIPKLKINNGLTYDTDTQYIQQGGSFVKDTTITLGTNFLQYTATDTAFKMIAGILTATFQTIILGKFLSTRDDTGTFAPVNFLYTGSDGKLYSSPLSVTNGLTKTLAGIFKLGGTLTEATTIDLNSFLLQLTGSRTYMTGKLGVGVDNSSTLAQLYAATTAQVAGLLGANTQAPSNSMDLVGSWGNLTLNGSAFTQSVEHGAYGVFGVLYLQQTGAQTILSESVTGVHGSLTLSVTGASAVSVPMLSAITATMNATDNGAYEDISFIYINNLSSVAYQSRPLFSGSIDNIYGLYIKDQNSAYAVSSGAVIYAIYQAGTSDKNYFAAKFTIRGTIASSTGAQTIDKPQGQIQVAAGQTSVVVTNAVVTTTSLIFVTVFANDATAKGAYVSAQSSGSFTISLTAAATGTVKVNFLVTDVG